MSFVHIHATAQDLELLRTYLNAETEVAWIVKVSEVDHSHHWRAQHQVDELTQSEYALWHMPSGSLTVPSGAQGIPDTIVEDPFSGWSQALDASSEVPWFGSNLPGPYIFHIRADGREAPGAVGRSEFFWQRDRFKSIGKPADESAKLCWQRLQKFVRRSSARIELPGTAGKLITNLFPEALERSRRGHHLDINS